MGPGLSAGVPPPVIQPRHGNLKMYPLFDCLLYKAGGARFHGPTFECRRAAP